MLARIRILPRLLIGFGILVVLITTVSGLGIYSGRNSISSFAEVNRLQNAEALDLEAELDLFKARMNI